MSDSKRNSKHRHPRYYVIGLFTHMLKNTCITALFHHKTTLIPPHFIVVPVCTKPGKWGSCICVRNIDFAFFDLIFDYGIVPTVCYFFAFILLLKMIKW